MKGEIAQLSVRIINHPLVEHKITLLRDRQTKPRQFRELLKELSILMACEITTDLTLNDLVVETPLGSYSGKTLGEEIVLLPVFRAGLGMVEGFLSVIPTARVGHLGLYRDEQTFNPVFYYSKLPDLSNSQVIVLDPMLATGGTASYCLEMLKRKKCSKVKLAFIISCMEGVNRLKHEHPGTVIYTCGLDQVLDEHAYIVPGLGDAGDRQFNT